MKNKNQTSMWSRLFEYSETPLIRTLMGLENSVLNRVVSLLEGLILTEIKALVTDSTVLIRGVSC